MKRFLYKGALLMMVFGLTACGYSLDELYDRASFNSVNFSDNYYTRWDQDISYKESKNKITNPEAETIYLDKTKDHVFTKFGEDNFRIVEGKYNNYVYEEDLSEVENEQGKLPYGPNNDLNDIDNSFRYGFMSRLFDGQLFCNGLYERARVQINSEGFGRTFSKELSEKDSPTTYFALSFKTSIEFRRVVEVDGQEVNIDIAKWLYGNSTGSLVHNTDIALTINFYLKNENGYERVPVYYEIDDVPCNQSDNYSRSNYYLFGFEIGNSVPSLDRCAGISIEYAYTDSYLDDINSRIDEINLANQSNPYFDTSEENLACRELIGGDVQHSILLYEIMFPNSTWH